MALPPAGSKSRWFSLIFHALSNANKYYSCAASARSACLPNPFRTDRGALCTATAGKQAVLGLRVVYTGGKLAFGDGEGNSARKTSASGDDKFLNFSSPSIYTTYEFSHRTPTHTHTHTNRRECKSISDVRCSTKTTSKGYFPNPHWLAVRVVHFNGYTSRC